MMSMFLEVSILCSYQRSILRLKSVIIVLKLKLFAIPPKSNTFFFRLEENVLSAMRQNALTSKGKSNFNLDPHNVDGRGTVSLGESR